jgi:hypothetical protein
MSSQVKNPAWRAASSGLSAPEPAFVHKSFRTFTGPRRSGPILNVRFGDKQLPSGAFRYSSKLVKNARPKLRHEGTFVDSIDEVRVHGLLFPITA